MIRDVLESIYDLLVSIGIAIVCIPENIRERRKMKNTGEGSPDWSLCVNCKLMFAPPGEDMCNGCKKDRLWYIG